MDATIQEYLEKIKSMQCKILDYLDSNNNNEENFQNLVELFDKHKIRENKHELKILLILLSKISSHHYRYLDFFNKIEKILLLFKDEIKQTQSKAEIFNIYKNSKRMLLFFLEQELLEITDPILETMSTKKSRESFFLHYFYPETKNFISKPMLRKIERELPEDYIEKRKKGENDDRICEIIRLDLIDDFIIQMNENKLTVKTPVKNSFFETNVFLNDNDPTLIEYAAFFGSIKIFMHLFKSKSNDDNLSPQLWLYAIHGRNLDIIKFLKENKIEIPIDRTYERCYEEAIKCHHNDIAYFIECNYLNKSNEIYNLENRYNINALNYGFRYYNFCYFANKIKNRFVFYYACQYGYYTLVDLLIKAKIINVNELVISKSIIFLI